MNSSAALTTANADIWKEISRSAYRKALANANPFEVDAARRNILLFRDLGLLPANVEAALNQMHQAAPEKPQPPARVILFTGHMLDAPDRSKDKARFPLTSEAEKAARRMIEEALRQEMNEEGIAGGACGSDILFHEVCESLGIPTRLLLALPEAKFQVESVNRGGSEWVERYSDET